MREVWAVCRGLARAPAFTAIAVTTLALGIGANTAVFGLFDALVLRPLPFEDAHELTRVALDLTERDGPARAGLTPADLLDFRAEPGLFAALAGWRDREAAIGGAGPADVVEVVTVTEGMFARVLRTQPSLGRSFLPEEHRPGAPATALLSHALWTDRLGADPGVLGRSISLDGQPHTIVGVMPAGFRPPFAPSAQAWTASRPVVERCRWCPSFDVLGRLAPGTTLPVALERAEAVAHRLAEAYPDTDAGVRLVVEPLGVERGRLRGSFRLLFLATGLVLLVACANVAHLVLMRGGGRRAELQLRAAVGARREALVRGLLLESLVLAAAGAGAGLFVGAWLVEGLAAIAPEQALLTEGIRIDPRLFSFNAALALAAVVLFGVGPAVRGARLPAGVPARAGRGLRPPRRVGDLWSSSLLTAQVALATALTVGSVVAGRALSDLRERELGFDPTEVLAIALTPVEGNRVRPENEQVLERYLARLAPLPGVLAVGATSALPLEPSGLDVRFRAGWATGAVTEPRRAGLRLVAGSYFYTVGQRVLEGRDLREGDEAAIPEPVVVNEAFARAHLGYPGRSALGARIALGPDGAAWRRVVGVVADVRSHARTEEPAVYAPHAVRPVGAMSVVVKSGADPVTLAASARDVLSGLAPDVAVRRSAPLGRLLDAELSAERFGAGLLGAFAALALVLSGVGLYAVLAARARGRRTETGIRLALGADAEDVRRLVTVPGLRVTLLGVTIGGGGTAWLAGMFETLVPSPAALDPTTFVVTSAILLSVAWLAAWGPARRSAGLDPASALRDE